MPELRAADMTPEDLAALLAEVGPPAGEPSWCWLEAPDGWVLDEWPGVAGPVSLQRANDVPRPEPLRALLPRVLAGRVFGPSGELRWRVLPALGSQPCRVTFLGDNWSGGRLAALPLRPELNGLTPAEESYPLWGQQTHATPGEWVELRIPHRLVYPVRGPAPGDGRVVVRLDVQLWKDSRGEVQFLRLCSLTPSLEP
jgi:hypothetical protein